MPSAMTCATAARRPRSRPGATARYNIRSANHSMRCGHALSASLAISRSSGASPHGMTSSLPASWDSSCSDASASGRGLSTGPSYAAPILGGLPIAQVDVGAVMRVIEPLWREKTETAATLRGRIQSVLDYAMARGWRIGENPARWRGHLDNLLPARSKVAKVEHHAALPWREIGAFMAKLA